MDDINIIDSDNWEDYTSYFDNDDDFDCINDNSYGIHEYRAGCPQDCSNCEYWQPSGLSLLRANNKLKKEENESKNQLRLTRINISGGDRQGATSILHRRGKTAILGGQAATPKRFECKKTRIS